MIARHGEILHDHRRLDLVGLDDGIIDPLAIVKLEILLGLEQASKQLRLDQFVIH